MTVYTAYGLTWSLPFACPALTPAPATPCDGAATVCVVDGDVPRSLLDKQIGEGGWEASPGSFLFRGGARGGRFWVRGGHVVVHRNPGADERVLGRQFVDRVLPAVLQQRGLLVMHANAVAVGGRALVITGESGAGKSTTANELLRRETSMLSDDVTALQMRDDSDIEVVPGGAQTHLTEDSATLLGVTYDESQLQPWRRMKVAIPIHDRMAGGPVPLGAMVVLGTSTAQHMTVRALHGAERFSAWNAALYGPMLDGDHDRVWRVLSAAAETMPVYRVERPAGRWSAHEVADAVCSLVGVPG
jgi:hypothetical protein